MKIIMIGPAYPWRGGIAHHTMALASQLRRSHAVEVFTFRRQYPNLLFPGKTQLDPGEPLFDLPTVKLIDSVNPLNWLSAGLTIRNKRADVLLFAYSLPFFGPCYGSIAAIARLNSEVKVVFLCHNIVPHERRPGDALFTRYAFRQADAFIVQSDVVEQDLRQFLPNATYRKVPHPLYNVFGQSMDKERARKQLGVRAEHVLLFFGYVRAYKGLHVLIDAVAHVVPHLDIVLLVVGEFYDDQQAYRAQIRRLQLERHVMITSEYVPNDRIGIYFSAADAAVLPYVSATQSGIAQIAYNFDKPVIASGVGGLGEVVQDGRTGYLVPPNDAGALAQAILRFYDGKKEAEFIRSIASEKQKYTWEAMARAVEELGSR